MEAGDLICGTPQAVCHIDEYSACPEADYYSRFGAFGQPDLRPTGIITEYDGAGLVEAQLDSYVLHSLADGERICYREGDGYGRREWFVETGARGFVTSAVDLPLIESSDDEESPRTKSAGSGEVQEVESLSLGEGILFGAIGVIVLFTICKSIIDAAEEGQRLEVLKTEEGGEQDTKGERALFVARPSHEQVAPEFDREPWKAERWFEGISGLGKLEVEEILREKVPAMLGDPVFRAEFIRDGRISAEGIRAILAEGGINHTGVGSVAVTRAMETKAADKKVIQITSAKKSESSPKESGFKLFKLFKKIGR